MDTIAVIDFGGQYAHLIANRIRRLGVYSEILSASTPVSQLGQYKGIILSGGPHSVNVPNSPRVDIQLFELGRPILGICYGMQLMSASLGGEVASSATREYGKAEIEIIADSPILAGLASREIVWMSHGDSVIRPAEGFDVVARTADGVNAAIHDSSRHFYGLQFHPEVTDTPKGMRILENFITICKCERSWNTLSYIEEVREDIRRTCEGRKVFLMVSGGVDSTVAFALLNQVLGPERVYGFHVDTGLMRHHESEAILEYMTQHGFHNLHITHAEDVFLEALRGVVDPEEKRRIIGNLFLQLKLEEEERLGLNVGEWLFGQGTIYPDTIESAGTEHADRIKTHHNRVDVVLDLIERGLVIEPLRNLYKDEVRELGRHLGLPSALIDRHPFPGPGLGVRLLCADEAMAANPPDFSPALCEELNHLVAPEYKAIPLPIRSVGVQGDNRTYAHPAVITATDPIPPAWDELAELSTRITNHFPEFNRVIYRIAGHSHSYTLHPAFVTKQRLDLLRFADNVAHHIICETQEYQYIWQMPVILLPLLNEDGKESIVLRPVTSQEAMTARFYTMTPQSLTRIVTELKANPLVGDIFFDITHKPPGTIEWE
ncbi:MAG: glutamine-hydrolyzing GMP synthase [Lentisphaerae bacterium]|nr:MAG: glutamine-hydrolyzing GMP synthase [Lentisphaerota bacterium]